MSRIRRSPRASRGTRGRISSAWVVALGATGSIVLAALLASSLWRIDEAVAAAVPPALQGSSWPAEAPLEDLAPSAAREDIASTARRTAGEDDEDPDEHFAETCADACANSCIRGRVEDRAGRGLAFARVEAIPAGPPGIGEPGLFGDPGDPHGAGECEVQCDEHGDFRIAVAPTQPFVIAADLAGYAKGAAPMRFAGQRARIVLSPGGRLRVFVQARSPGTSGEPYVAVVGAQVRAFEQEEGALRAHWMREEKTDEEGQVVFDSVPAGRIQVLAMAATYVTRHGELTSDGEREDSCALDLSPGGAIEGLVVDKLSGLPIQGAKVGCEALGFVSSDVHGRYHLGEIQLGSSVWGIGASASGHMPRFEYLTVSEVQRNRVLDFELEPSIRVRGTVRGDDARPIARARVEYVGQIESAAFAGTTLRGETRTDLDGRFELDDVRAETAYRLVVRAEGFGAKVSAFGPFGSGSPPSNLGALPLEAPASIAGEVPGLQLPEQWTLVRLVWAGEDEEGSRARLASLLATVRTDRRGRFAFHQLASGRYRLELLKLKTGVSQAGEAPVALCTLDLRPGEARRNVVLRFDERAVCGRVVDESKGPIQNRTVTLRDFDARGPVVTSGLTSASGAFRLPVESAGPFHLTVSDPMLFFETCTLEQVLAGEPGIELVMPAFRSPFSIRGRVREESGRPAERVLVAFTDAFSGEKLGRLGSPDENGRFEMRNLRDRPYHVEVLDYEGRYEPLRLMNVKPLGDEIELQLVPRK